MDDERIVDLFFERNEEAIKEAQEKYSRYCNYIASNILPSQQDCEECVSDTFLRAWNSIPPNKPNNLKAFLGKITRNLSLDRLDRNTAQKRRTESTLVYDEIAECIPDTTTQELTDELALKTAINKFLGSLKEEKRIIFLQRYWYLSSVKDIAINNGLSENNVKIILMRLRAKLKKFLEKEGITI